jgi:antitoxin component of RelBE/YafQ-DinJ toxin-antitoxin module
MGKGEHRIQVRLDDEGWERAELAAKKNGVSYVSSLCEMLLEKEYQRLGLDAERRTADDVEAPEEHRLNVRIKGLLWVRAQERASALGLGTISDLCRVLLERDLESWIRDSGASDRKRQKKAKPSRRK